MLALLTRGSIAPGVHAGSGSPAWRTQPVVLVRGAGVQKVTSSVGTGTATVAMGSVVGAAVGAGTVAAVATGSIASMGTTVGVTDAGVPVQPARARAAVTKMPRK